MKNKPRNPAVIAAGAAIALVGCAAHADGKPAAAAATSDKDAKLANVQSATIDKRDALMAKAIADPKFQERLLSDPAAAVNELGLDITDSGIKAIQQNADQIRKDAHNILFTVQAQAVYVTTCPTGTPPKECHKHK